jgi:hypothetical protein
MRPMLSVDERSTRLTDHTRLALPSFGMSLYSALRVKFLELVQALLSLPAGIRSVARELWGGAYGAWFWLSPCW